MSKVNPKDLRFSIPRYGQAALIAQACRFHNAQEKAKAERLEDLYAEARYISPRSHPQVLARACTQFLIAKGLKQYPELSTLRGNSEAFESWRAVKNQLLSAIATAIPWLADECQRQQI